jgi:hypothetical protein
MLLKWILKELGFFDVCWINLAVDMDRFWAVVLHGNEPSRKIKGVSFRRKKNNM